MSTSAIDLSLPYKKRVDDALHNKQLKVPLDRATGRMAGQRVAAMGAVDAPRLRAQVRQMKEHVLRTWPELLEQLETQVTANGGHVRAIQRLVQLKHELDAKDYLGGWVHNS